LSAQDGIITALQFGNFVLETQAHTLEQLHIFLLAMSLAGIDQSVDPPVTATQTVKMIVHSVLHRPRPDLNRGADRLIFAIEPEMASERR
jgi:hypothetical protein